MRLTAELVIRDRSQSLFSANGEFVLPGLAALAHIDPARIADLVVESMSEMVDYATAIVPVRTGALQASIRVEPFIEDSRVGGMLIAGNESVDYAKYVEAGPHPRPFIRPTFESLGEVTESRAITAIKGYIQGLL